MLRKVTLNLNEDDVRFFEDRFGWGWSAELRRIMHREVVNYESMDVLQDFINEENTCGNSRTR
jgi:hypothetical protein